MSYKVSRKLAKHAWAVLGEEGVDPDGLSEAMAAATISGLLEYSSSLDWRAKPPADTVFKVVDRAVFLSFDPERSMDLSQPAASEERSREVLFDIPAPIQQALRVIGLKTLDGNLEWSSDPEALLGDPR